MDEQPATPNPVPSAPEATQPATVSSAPSPKSKKPVLIIAGVLGVILVAVASYFAFNMINTPVQVKEKSQLAQPVFLDFSKTVKKIGEHVRESSGSDSDSLERYGQEGKSLLKDADRDKKALQTHVENMTIPALSVYKDTLEMYIQETNNLIDIENDNVSASEAYVDPIRRYEKLSVEISGESTYMYTNPKRYLEAVDNAIIDEKDIIEDLKKFKTKGVIAEQHDSFIKTLEVELSFLEEIAAAVAKRDTNAITAATKQYSEDIQNNSKESSRLSDKLKKQTKDYESDLELLADKVEVEYSSLRSSYRF